MEKLTNVHPGEILQQEFLEPMDITAYYLAKTIGVPQNRLLAIIRGQRAITADTALRLGKFFGTTPNFWLNLQNEYDLREEREKISNELAEIATYE